MKGPENHKTLRHTLDRQQENLEDVMDLTGAFNDPFLCVEIHQIEKKYRATQYLDP